MRNQERDARVCRELEEQGWDPHIIWGCNIKRVLDCVMKVVRCHLFPRTSVGLVYLSDGVLQCDSFLDNIFSGGSGAGYPAVMVDAWSGVLIVTGERYSSVVVGVRIAEWLVSDTCLEK